MKHLALILFVGLSACTTAPKHKPLTETEIQGPPKVRTDLPLQDRLGMRRQATDLGFAEKPFSACQEGGICQPRYFSVVHFQLLCRDSEGTVSSVPTLTPLTSDRVRWQLGGQTGGTSTDRNGFGQFTLVSDRPTRGQRLILRIGQQFMGFTISEVSKVVLPQNFCI